MSCDGVGWITGENIRNYWVNLVSPDPIKKGYAVLLPVEKCVCSLAGESACLPPKQSTNHLQVEIYKQLTDM